VIAHYCRRLDDDDGDERSLVRYVAYPSIDKPLCDLDWSRGWVCGDGDGRESERENGRSIDRPLSRSIIFYRRPSYPITKG
jgi:hypothetical protein